GDVHERVRRIAVCNAVTLGAMRTDSEPADREYAGLERGGVERVHQAVEIERLLEIRRVLDDQMRHAFPPLPAFPRRAGEAEGPRRMRDAIAPRRAASLRGRRLASLTVFRAETSRWRNGGDPRARRRTRAASPTSTTSSRRTTRRTRRAIPADWPSGSSAATSPTRRSARTTGSTTSSARWKRGSAAVSIRRRRPAPVSPTRSSPLERPASRAAVDPSRLWVRRRLPTAAAASPPAPAALFRGRRTLSGRRRSATVADAARRWILLAEVAAQEDAAAFRRLGVVAHDREPPLVGQALDLEAAREILGARVEDLGLDGDPPLLARRLLDERELLEARAKRPRRVHGDVGGAREIRGLHRALLAAPCGERLRDAA